MKFLKLFIKNLFFLFLFCIFNINFLYAKTKENNILFISAYNYDWETVSYQLEGFNNKINPLDNIDYIFMDSKNIPYSDAVETTLSLINKSATKYASYDCIVVADDNALDFTLLHKKDCFGDAPIVFLAINDVKKAQDVAKAADVCGIVEKGYYKETLDFAVELYPFADTLYAITDNTISAAGTREQLESVMGEHNLALKYINTSELTPQEIKNILGSLNKHSILIYLNFRNDVLGNDYSEKKAAKFVFDNASVPCFRTDYPNIEYGLLGGIVLKFAIMGEQAADLATRFCNGDDMSSVTTLITPDTMCLNDDVIKKFNLKIPKKYSGEIEIINQHLSFIQKYFIQIFMISCSLVIGLLSIIILLLLRNNKVQGKQKLALQCANYDLSMAYKQVKIAEAYARNANKIKSDFLARMSHDMRTPLTAIMGLSNFGIKEIENKKSNDYFKKIYASASYLLSLVNDILDMQRIESESIQFYFDVYDLNELIFDIESIVKQRANEKNINLVFTTKLEAGTEYIITDEKRFEQIFINLLNNAIKYTESGKKVTFDVSTTVQNAKCFLTVKVVDTGVGMSEEFQKKMYDSFTKENNSLTQSEGGTGLGLSITKKLVEAMQGSIDCSSTLGKGTTFIVKIPVTRPSASQIAQVTKMKQRNDNLEGFVGKHILLCEDNAINTEIAEHLLKKKGFIVHCAENGKIACEMYENSLHDSSVVYSAILMDIRMPVMNGLEATEKIREMDKKIPIIALSANAYKEDIEKSLQAGMNAHLMKPIESEKLYKELAKLII
ncbi:MAG: hypothetical protein BKP49_09415 [Treponema sp. CETP13]|nr:MAG: hypothetical protein BKP49_09415 [Treponema sp. CETP13]